MQPAQPANHYYVYIMGDQTQPQLIIGISENLLLQLTHESGHAGHPKLVYYEHYDLEEIALVRERRIKSFAPEEHLRLVESMNPNWLDLADTLS